MNRFSIAARPCLLLLAAVAIATAQEPAPTPQPTDELRALRETVEQQNKKLEALTQQIVELNRRVSSGKMPAPPSTPAPEPVSALPAPPSPPSLTPAPTPASPAAAAAKVPAPAAPSAVATPAPAAAAADGVKHTVAKGETLTSIAKRYNIPLSELEKANKITDERKLQIGHVVNIPTTPNKTPEPPTDNKENP